MKLCSFVALLFILLAGRGFAAIGDTTGAEITAQGSRIRTWIDLLNTNGTFYNGFDTNNSLTGTQKFTLSIVRTGYTASAALQLTTNPAYGTIIERAVWPMDTTNHIDPNILGSIANIWLSEDILAGDLVTASALDGYYAVTNGTGTNAAAFSGLAVTNLSEQQHVRVIANWSPRTPRYQRFTNSQMRLSVVAFHESGRDRKPVQMVRFIHTGLTSGVKTTNDITRMSVDTAWYSQATYWNLYTNLGNIQAGEFNVTVDLSPFAGLEVVRSDFQAFPIRGDVTAVVDTTLDTYLQWSPLPTQIRNVYDPSNHYSKAVAIVHEVLGTNATGVVVTNGDYTTVPATGWFATIGGALNAAAATNNLIFGHNDTGGAIIWCASCPTNPGTTITATTVPTVAPLVITLPGSNNVITHTAGSSASMKRIRYEGINMAVASAQIPWTSYDWVSFDKCTNMSVSTAPFSTCTNIVFTRASIGSFAQGLISASTAHGPGVSLQAVDLKHFNQASYVRTWIAVIHPDTNGGNYTVRNHLAGANPVGYEILYNSYLDGSDQANPVLIWANDSVSSIGSACVQNFFGKATPNQPLAGIGGGGVFTNATNVIIWLCDFDGARIADLASNGTEADTKWRKRWSMVGNVWSYPGQKGDREAGSEDADRIGGWDQLNMVNGRGNVYMRNAVFPSGTAFRPEFAGLLTYEPGVTNVANWARFRLRKTAIINTANSEGGGNPMLFTDSPLLHSSLRIFNSPLPFDILGHARGEFSPAGCYSEADLRK